MALVLLLTMFGLKTHYYVLGSFVYDLFNYLNPETIYYLSITNPSPSAFIGMINAEP